MADERIQRVLDFMKVWDQCSQQKMIASTGAATVLWADDLRALCTQSEIAEFPDRKDQRIEQLERELVGARAAKIVAQDMLDELRGKRSATTVRSVVEKIIHDLDAEGRASVVVAWGRQDGEPTIRKWLDEWVKKNASDRNIP